jgi:F-type H+/Na+-transporting ATPase subunit alpha
MPTTDSLEFDLRSWGQAMRARIARSTTSPRIVAAGRLTGLFDSVVLTEGLHDVHVGDGVWCLPEDGGAPVPALVSGIDGNTASCVLLGHGEGLRAGTRVRAGTGPVDIPVGPAQLGRMLDPLGQPLDGGPVPTTTVRSPVERLPPPILARALIERPLHTGTTAIDALIPLGRGQRELVIGDRRTGKSTLALDAILSQQSGDVVCVHVSIGQRTVGTLRALESVRARGLADNCVFVVATADDPPGLQWLAPFAGCAIAEWFRDAGRDVLLVLDDLTKHAATHRQISLLLRNPPGREAYPGDVFYLHARLLERAAKLAPELGGGSLSILAVAETQGNDISGYIPTNLISIVDGQIVCDAKLWALGQRPAIDIGRSVSRVGGRAQPAALRRVAGDLKLVYAQFLELEEFARFGGLADGAARARLAHGLRLRAALAQPANAPLSLPAQYALLSAVRAGLLDALPIASVAILAARVEAVMRANFADLCAELEAGAAIADTASAQLLEALAALLAGAGAETAANV